MCVCPIMLDRHRTESTTYKVDALKRMISFFQMFESVKRKSLAQKRMGEGERGEREREKEVEQEGVNRRIRARHCARLPDIAQIVITVWVKE